MIEGWAKNPLSLAGLALVSALVGATAFWLFQQAVPSQRADADRGRMEVVVHDYILAHPEILPEAMQKLQERETAQRQTQAAGVVAANAGTILKPFGSAWAGNPHGNLTIAEYFDYNCGYCRASLPVIAQLLASDPQLRIVYHEMPVLSDESDTAAKLSLAAAEQGKFQAFHNALYAGGRVTPDSMAAAARTAGIDMARAAAFAPQAEAQIAANLDLVRKMGLTGTPSWVIGNRVISAALPLDELQKVIAAARAGG